MTDVPELLTQLDVTYRQLDEAEIAQFFAGRYVVNGECWEYQGHDHRGYRRIGVAKRRVLVHHYSLELTLGRRVAGYALHTCDNPPCFRPSHLYEGTPADNMRDRDMRGRAAVGRRHGNAKLTPDQVADILRRYKPGHDRWHRGNAHELASEYGIAKGYVAILARMRHWSLRGEMSE